MAFVDYLTGKHAKKIGENRCNSVFCLMSTNPPPFIFFFKFSKIMWGDGVFLFLGALILMGPFANLNLSYNPYQKQEKHTLPYLKKNTSQTFNK